MSGRPPVPGPAREDLLVALATAFAMLEAARCLRALRPGRRPVTSVPPPLPG